MGKKRNADTLEKNVRRLCNTLKELRLRFMYCVHYLIFILSSKNKIFGNDKLNGRLENGQFQEMEETHNGFQIFKSWDAESLFPARFTSQLKGP